MEVWYTTREIKDSVKRPRDKRYTMGAIHSDIRLGRLGATMLGGRWYIRELDLVSWVLTHKPTLVKFNKWLFKNEE